MTPTKILKDFTELNLPLTSNVYNVYYYKDKIYRVDYKKDVVSSFNKSVDFDTIKDSKRHKPMYKELRYDRSYINMAEVWKMNSYAVRNKVGALFVKDSMIISDGFNGTPAGFPNECEDENNHSHQYVMHAEQNAISKLARSNHSSDGSSLYVSLSPCPECSKQIIQSGVRRVIFWDFYRITVGVNWLLKSGVDLTYYDYKVLNEINGL